MVVVATLSVTALTRTPIPINRVATSTGLSPEFHLASFRIGKAGSFFRPALRADLLSRNQSVNNHRSNAREDDRFFGVASETVSRSDGEGLRSKCLDSSMSPWPSSSSRVGLDSRSSSRYSLTGPRAFEMARLVRDVGTTCVCQTHATTAHNMRMIDIPIQVAVDGRMGSNTMAGG